MTEFWLISAPGEKTCQQTWEKLHAATAKNNNLAVTSKFNIPDLKVKLRCAEDCGFVLGGPVVSLGRSRIPSFLQRQSPSSPAIGIN
jgi:hypothetical protein